MKKKYEWSKLADSVGEKYVESQIEANMLS